MDRDASDKSSDPIESKIRMVDLLDVNVGCSTVVYAQVSESEQERILNTDVHPNEYFVQENCAQLEETECCSTEQYIDQLHENAIIVEQNHLHYGVHDKNIIPTFHTIGQQQFDVQLNQQTDLEKHNDENVDSDIILDESLVKTAIMLENTLITICPTCLMAGRSLFLVKNANTAYSMLRAMDGDEHITQHSVVCWECNARIRRMMQFGEQVLNANNVMRALGSREQKEIHSLSSLSAIKKVGVDIKIIHRSPELPAKRTNKSRWNTKEPPTRRSARRKKPNPSYENSEIMKPSSTEPDEYTEHRSTEEINADIPLMACKKHFADSQIIEDLLERPDNKDSESLKLAKVEMRKMHKTRALMQYRLKRRLAGLLVKRRSNTKIVASTIPEQDMLRFREERMKDPSYANATHRCELCIKGFPYLDHLRRHNTQIHSLSAGDYSCDICQLRTATSESLARHRKRHYSLYMCTRCDFTTAINAEARAHWTNVHEKGQQFPCDECHLVFDTLRRRRYHRQVEHRAPNACHLCGKTFTTASVLKEHMTLHTGKKQLPCSECGKACRGDAALYAHLRNAHGRAPPLAEQLYCRDCDLQFRTRSAYRAHLYSAEKHVPPALLRFQCSVCEKRFRTQGLLNAHRTQYHTTSDCRVCGKTFSNVYTVRSHSRRVHEGYEPSKTHICEVCGKAFATASRLAAHVRTHTGEKSCECDICHTKFTQKGYLAKHIKKIHPTTNSELAFTFGASRSKFVST